MNKQRSGEEFGREYTYNDSDLSIAISSAPDEGPGTNRGGWALGTLLTEDSGRRWTTYPVCEASAERVRSYSCFAASSWCARCGSALRWSM